MIEAALTLSSAARAAADETIALRVDGEPFGWQRAGVNARGRKPRHYDQDETKAGKARFVEAWRLDGEPFLGERGARVPVALAMRVEAVFVRFDSHYRKNGELSAAGLRAPWPTCKPDFDNIIKLIADALNGKAYVDDAHIAHAVVVKRWANPGEDAHTVVRILALPTPGLPEAA